MSSSINIENSLLHFINASQLAAIACYEHIGTGDKIKADEAATAAMRKALNSSPINTKVVIGEGEMDEAPMLYIDERLGLLVNYNSLDSDDSDIDIAVDPLEGTNLCANNFPGAMTTIAFGSSGSIFAAPDIYMQKLIVSAGYCQFVSLENDIQTNIRLLANAKGCQAKDIKIIMLDRERHKNCIKNARALGAKVTLITDGDIGASLNVLLDKADIYWGSGGGPEGVLSACAAKGFENGNMFGKLLPSCEAEKERLRVKFGISDYNKVYNIDDMVQDDCYFIASGVTNGDILKGVSLDHEEHAWSVQTLVISSKSKSRHFINSYLPKNDS